MTQEVEEKEGKVTLENYGARVKVIVEEFLADQQAHHDRNSEDNPLEMELGQWDERFFIYLITKG